VIITGAAKIAGVMGWPISHSLSPRLHGFWLDHYNIDGAYLPLAVMPEHFENAVRALPKLGFKGANVTVPHKEAAFAAMDTVSVTAKRLGAVNTIVIGADGQLHGDNTDGYGFMENLRTGQPDLDLQGQKAVVLGAGGAARAIVAALCDAGLSEVKLVNRTFARAEALARDIGGAIVPCAETEISDALDGAALLVNTTSLGMVGHEPLNIDLAPLPTNALVTDIVYNPLDTPLLLQAQNNGHQTINGIGMLLHQARPGFAAWFDVEPEVTADLRDHVLAGLDE
jgi:shikimate dehydrogenase